MLRAAPVATLLAALLITPPAAAQSVLILDDTNGITESLDAANRLGLDVVNTRNLAGFIREFESREEWDLVILDVARLAFTGSLADRFTTHLDAGGAAILSYANLDGNERLRDLLGVDCTGDPAVLSYASTPADGLDLFTFFETVPSPLVGQSRYTDNGDVCESRGESLVLARFADADADAAIYTTREAQVLVNGVVFDAMREAPGVTGGDGDGDGVRDIVELVENEILALLDLQTPGLVVYSDGPTPEIDRMAVELDLDVFRPSDLAELDALIADDDYYLAYIALSDLAAAEPGLQDRIGTLRESDTPVFFTTPDFDAAPAWAAFFGITTGDHDDASAVVPGSAGLERVVFRQPEVYDGLAVTAAGGGDARDSITDPGGMQVLARFGADDGPIALVGDLDGGLVVGSFSLAELGGEDLDGDGLSESTELLSNVRAFARDIGPIALLATDVRAEGLESELGDAAAGLGYYSLLEETGADAAATLAVMEPAIVLVESVGADGTTFDDAAFVDGVSAHLDAGGSLVLTAADLDAMSAWRALLGVSTEGDLGSPRVVERDRANLGRVFSLPEPTPSTLATAALARDDHGDELSISGVGSVVGRFSGGAPAIVMTRNGRVIANGFVPQAIGQEDTDGDRLRDIQQLLRAQIHATLSPQQTLLLDDDDSLPSVLGEGAQRAGLAVVRVTDAPSFAAAFDAGVFQQIAFDCSRTDALVDPRVWSRVTAWSAETRGMTIAYTNFDAYPDRAAELGLSVADATERSVVVESFADATSIFRSPFLVPTPISRAPALYGDPGDELALIDGGELSGRFAFNLGPGAIALGPTGTTAINAFAPRELVAADLDLDGVDDRVALFANQMVRTGRVPVPIIDSLDQVSEGRTLVVDASGSFDPFDEALEFAWDLDEDGDFIDASGPTATLDATTMDGPTTIMIAVRVSNASGLQAISRFEVEVTNAPPTVDAGGDRTVDQGSAATFSAVVDDVPDDTWIVEWEFGDGEGDVGEATTHMYADLGVYDAAVTVTDDDGGVTRQAFTVTYQNLAPSVELEPHPAIDEGEEATFRAAVADVGGDPVVVTWSFGDGGEAEGLEVNHQYLDDGRFDVVATATDIHDGTSTDRISVTVMNVAPSITSEPVTTANAAAEYRYDVTVSDPGADEITFALEAGPAGMTISEAGGIRWTPPATGFEDVDVRLLVRDDDGGEAAQAWTISITFADRDSGGAPDTCEINFGFDPDDAADDESDPDGDGLTVAEECITGRDPTVFSGPGAPELLSPIDGRSWSRPFVELEVANAIDPDGDPLVYDFQIYNDDELTDLFAEALGVDEVATGTTTTVFVEPYEEDHLYSWRARAGAVDVVGPWSDPARFVFNMRNAPPGRPTAVSPVGFSAENPPVLLIDNATDPELEPLTYDFELYSGDSPRPEALIWSAEGVPEGDVGQTSVAVDIELEEGFRYTWRVRAKDAGEPPGTGPYELVHFSVDSSNGPPTLPEPLSPIDGAEIAAGSSLTLTWRNSEDPDDDRIRYSGDIATDRDFESVVRPFAADEDPANTTTSVLVTMNLLPERAYYWRVAAHDRRSTTPYAFGDFVTAAPFFNSPPSIPTPISPLAGSRISSEGSVELIVDNATDVDDNALTYQFQVAIDVEMRTLAFRAEGVEEGQDTTSVLVEDLNAFDYFWRARATDGVDPGQWSPINGFTVEDDRARPEPDTGVDRGFDAGVDEVGDLGPSLPTSGQLGGGGGCASAPRVGRDIPWFGLGIIFSSAFAAGRRRRPDGR